MSVTTIRFACDHCGRDLRARAEAAGRRVRCPGCGVKTDVRPPRAVTAAGIRVGWPWLAGAGALVVAAAVVGVVMGGRASVGDVAGPAVTPVVSTPTTAAPQPPADTAPPAGPVARPEAPVAPARPSDWKMSGVVVRNADSVLADFNRVVRPDDGYELVEVFCDVASDGPARAQGFDFFGVLLVARDRSKADAEPVRRVAMGFSLSDEGPGQTTYTIPTVFSVAKAGDDVAISHNKTGAALTVWPRVTGDQTGPVRMAPKQNPTRLGFVFSVPAGQGPVELRLADATLPLPSDRPPAAPASAGPGASDPDLEGTWKLVKVYDQYEPGNQSYLLLSSHYVMTVRGTEMTVETEDGGKKKATPYTLTADRTKTPRVYHETGAGGKPRAGIYRIDGNKLITCTQKDGKPPADFTARRGDGKGRQIMEYERVK